MMRAWIGSVCLMFVLTTESAQAFAGGREAEHARKRIAVSARGEESLAKRLRARVVEHDSIFDQLLRRRPSMECTLQ